MGILGTRGAGYVISQHLDPQAVFEIYREGLRELSRGDDLADFCRQVVQKIHLAEEIKEKDKELIRQQMQQGLLGLAFDLAITARQKCNSETYSPSMLLFKMIAQVLELMGVESHYLENVLQSRSDDYNSSDDKDVYLMMQEISKKFFNDASLIHRSMNRENLSKD